MQHAPSLFPLRLLGLCALFLFSACQQKGKSTFAERMNAPEAPARSETEAAPVASEQFQEVATNGEIFSSSAAMASGIDSLKKFIRNAEITFSVQNTASATFRIEEIARQNGGFVINSNLNSEIELRQTTPISPDSALETIRYTLHSQLVIRVPYRLLDTTLRTIGRLSEFLDSRQVSAEDVGLQMLEKELTRLREDTYRTDLSHSAENKLNPKADRIRDSHANTDQAHLEALKLEDQIRFSTIKVNIHQQPQIHRTMVANTELQAVRKPFFVRMGEALQSGGDILLLLFFGIIDLWGLILLAVVAYFGWNWFQKRKKMLVSRAQKSE